MKCNELLASAQSADNFFMIPRVFMDKNQSSNSITFKNQCWTTKRAFNKHRLFMKRGSEAFTPNESNKRPEHLLVTDITRRQKSGKRSSLQVCVKNKHWEEAFPSFFKVLLLSRLHYIQKIFNPRLREKNFWTKTVSFGDVLSRQEEKKKHPLNSRLHRLI